ncbi:hypothetical protein [Halomonas sp. PA16-9]|uniref:hypothetical protein n=1 Tax=Halomonas sp. PA16-9 TaxID=2576841 RepID=UPI0030EB535C
MLRQLPADVVEEFERKGLLYVRTFTRNLDVSWRDFFKTDSKERLKRGSKKGELSGSGWVMTNCRRVRAAQR